MEHITQKELDDIDFWVQTDYTRVGSELIKKLLVSYVELKEKLEES